MADQEEGQLSESDKPGGQKALGLSKSGTCASKVVELCNKRAIKKSKESQFESMVCWVTEAEKQISQLMQQSSLQKNPYENVRFAPIISALLHLLDAQILSRELALMGIKLIRKIVEVENPECLTPAADWDSDDWVPYKRMIQVKQSYLVERGCIPFLCKLLAESSEPSVQEECILVCIALILGGNVTSQNAFVNYMIYEDASNKFLMQVKGMLQKYFEQTKKFLTEKNAKLEMVQKIRKQ